MLKKCYNVLNPISHFKDKVLKEKDIKVGFVLGCELNIKIITNDTIVDLSVLQGLVGGYIEPVNYIEDENFEVYVDEDGISKQKCLNLQALIITGFSLYGDVVFLRKGVLK